MNRFTLSLVVGSLVFATSLLPQRNEVVAQSPPEPAVVVSIADISQQIGDVDYLIEASGFGQMKFMAQTMIKQYTKGIDTKSPAGVLLYFEDNNPQPEFLGFIPISNLDDLLDTIAGVADVQEGDDLTVITTDVGAELFVKEVGDHAFISNNEDMFDDLPTHPLESLGKLPTQYNLSAKVFTQRVPQELRDQAMQAIREGGEEAMEEEFSDDQPLAELQRKNFEMQMQQLEKYINEIESLTVGLAASKKSQSIYVEGTAVAVPGSELAEQMSAYPSDEPSMFKGFLMEGASFTANSRMNVSQYDIEQYQQMSAQLKDDLLEELLNEADELSADDKEVLQKAVTEVLDVVNETVAEGKMDVGAVLMLQDDDANLAFGLKVANSQKLEATLKDVLAHAEKKAPGEFTVQFNSGSFQDVTYHRVTVPVKDNDDAAEFFGDEIAVVFGIGKEAVYFAGGTDPEAFLNKAISGESAANVEKLDNGEPVLLQYNINMAPILKFAANLENEEIVEMMAQELEANGRDSIRVVAQSIENGMSMRFEMQDGILALIKVAADNFGAGGGFPGGENDF